ncbi:unnamed protein product [Microthlaspi erraticum]|uniref:Uncharacterized protein n=1 Tax=Microthlaspi erraticum TaxID=1685480 RepID=A0A6D2KX57_9BRAS|nr:unnamed protein product [Microthlaspi erraticum]
MEGLGTWTQLNWKKKGGSHLEDQLDHYSTNRSSSSTRPAKLQLDRAEKSKSNPKNVASPLTSFDPKPNPLRSNPIFVFLKLLLLES